MPQKDQIITEFTSEVKQFLGNNLIKITLFGSRARGDHKKHSDYDFLIVVNKKNASYEVKLLDICVNLLNKYDVLVSYILCDTIEWERKKRFPIGLNIVKEGYEL